MQVFKITIEQLDIGTSEDCGKECLRFSDSFGESVDLCGKLTQADHCVYTTLGNQLTTEFLTDDTPALESFKVTLSAVDPGSVLRTCGRLFHRSVLRALVDALWDRGTCGGTLTAPSGSFNTPGYPASYPSYQDCRWTISANWGKVSQIGQPGISYTSIGISISVKVTLDISRSPIGSQRGSPKYPG